MTSAPTKFHLFAAALGPLPDDVITTYYRAGVGFRFVLRRTGTGSFATIQVIGGTIIGATLGQETDDGTELVFTYDDCKDPAGIGRIVREHLLEGDPRDQSDHF